MSENKNNLVCISGVRGYEQDGVAHLHIEDAPRGLGFTTKVNDTEYVRWPRVDEYLGDFGFLPQVANEENPHDDSCITSEPLEKSRGFPLFQTYGAD